MTEPTTNAARLAKRSLTEGGTPVKEWIDWERGFPPLNVDHCPGLVLVAAHPDDETLGFGGTAAHLAAHGVPVQIVAVTDGEAAHPDDSRPQAELANMRREELIAAAACLGCSRPIFLGIPDGEVAANEERLEIELEAVLAESIPGAWCAATWRADGHPDHEATGRAASLAAKDAPAVLFEYPIWMWHWAFPDDSAVPWHRARRVSLTPHDRAAKDAAMRSFSSGLLSAEIVGRQMAVGEIAFV